MIPFTRFKFTIRLVLEKLERSREQDKARDHSSTVSLIFMLAELSELIEHRTRAWHANGGGRPHTEIRLVYTREKQIKATERSSKTGNWQLNCGTFLHAHQ